jgi:hypothetical protein
MPIKYPYYNCCLLISTEPNNLKELFHQKLIFNTLLNDHLARLFLMQKIKKTSSNPTSITIYLHNFKITDFNLNKKLLKLIEQNDYKIKYKNIDQINDKDVIEIATYSKFMDTYSINKDSQ